MRILIPIDCSPFAHEVIEEIASRTWTNDTEFRLITVVEPTGTWDADHPYSHQAKEILEERIKLLKKRLPELRKLKGDVLEGNSSEMILEEATNWRADLIILGSHGDTGVRKDTLGSVAAAVVNKSPCTVEVVKLHRKSLQLK